MNRSVFSRVIEICMPAAWAVLLTMGAARSAAAQAAAPPPSPPATSAPSTEIHRLRPAVLIPRESAVGDACRPARLATRSGTCIMGRGPCPEDPSRFGLPTQPRIGRALAMVNDVVAAHRGRMDVRSSTDVLDHGTTVRLIVPAPAPGVGTV